MTIAATQCVAVFEGDGTRREFPFPFPFFASSEILAAVRFKDQTERILVQGTDYAVNGTSLNGVLTHPLTGQPLPRGGTLTVYRGSPFRQNLDIVENDPFPSKLIEDEFDRMALRDQELAEAAGRALAHPRGVPEGGRASAGEFLDIVRGIAGDISAHSARATGFRSLAEIEAASAEFSAGSAQVEADRARGIQAEAQRAAGWWKGTNLAPTRLGPNEFEVAGDHAGEFAVNRAVRIHDAETRYPVAGHVVRAVVQDGRTRVLVSSDIPETPAEIELGQPPEAAPIPNLTVVPVLNGPSSAVEGSVADFSLSRLDGSPYARDTLLEHEVRLLEGGTDQTSLFGLAQVPPDRIRLSLPAVEAETGFLVRVRTRDSPLDWSPWSPFREIVVHPTEFYGDNAALFAASADDWPNNEGETAFSRTVGQDAGQDSWTTLCARATYDPSESEMNVDGFNGETLFLSQTRSGLLSSGGLLLVKPPDSGTCALVRPVSVAESGSGPYTYVCAGLSGMPGSVERVWATPAVSAAGGLSGEPLHAETPLNVVDVSDLSAPVVLVAPPVVLDPSFLNATLTARVGDTDQEREYIAVLEDESDPGLRTLVLSAPFSGTPSSLRLKSAFIGHPLAEAEFDSTTGQLTVEAAPVSPPSPFRATAMSLAQPPGLAAVRPFGQITLWNAE